MGLKKLEFRCRDLEMNIFEFSCDTVSEAIRIIEDYESENNTWVRCFEKATGRRIIGGALVFPIKENLKDKKIRPSI